MITENYVSFNTAILLNKKGFDGIVHSYYHIWDGPNHPPIPDSIVNDSEAPHLYIIAPTLQIACKWLREAHNIHVVLKFDFNTGYYTGRIYDGRRESTIEKDDYIAIVGNRTYEQACEEAIKYCLEKLI